MYRGGQRVIYGSSLLLTHGLRCLVPPTEPSGQHLYLPLVQLEYRAELSDWEYDLDSKT